MLAGDHSTAGAIIGGSLKRDGLGAGIIRYACGGRGSVNITPGEIADLKANGIPIGIVLEHEADWLLRPGVAGRVQASLAITRACGVPDGVIYMAVDFDVTNGGPTSPGSVGDRQMHRVAAGLSEAASVIGHDNVGFYGSKFGIDWLEANAPLKWYWQTEAWSMGQRHPKACLFQRAQAMNVAGVQVDIDDVLLPHWGQRVHSAPPPPPNPGKGTANLLVRFDVGRNSWSLKPLPGVVKWSPTDEWASVELQVNKKTGQWRFKGLPFNAPPLGK